MWRLRYTNRALRWFETATGVSIMALERVFNGGDLNLETITYLVAAGLYHEKRDVTLDDADDLLDECGFHPTFQAVKQAFEQSTMLKNAPETAGETSGKAKKPGTGNSSKKRQPASV